MGAEKPAVITSVKAVLSPAKGAGLNTSAKMLPPSGRVKMQAQAPPPPPRAPRVAAPTTGRRIDLKT